MTQIANNIPTGTVGPDGTVIIDVPCRKCGYNLRSLHIDNRCPECGAAVGFSVQGDFLQFSEPSWLETLARGARIYIIGVAILVIGGIAISMIINGRIYSQVVQLIGFSLMTIGWWKLTEPDPSGLGEDRYGTSRKIIRFGLLGGVVDKVVGMIIMTGGVLPSVLLVAGLMSISFRILWIVALFAQLNYLRKLSLRIPDARLERRSMFLTKAIAITMGLGILIPFLFTLVSYFGGLNINRGITTVMLILIVWALILAILYLLLVEKMGKRFRELAGVARRTWATVGTVSLP